MLAKSCNSEVAVVDSLSVLDLDLYLTFSHIAK